MLSRIAVAGAVLAAMAVAPASLMAQRGQAPPPAAEPLSALAPENLSRQRPQAPFDLTGNWFVDTSAGPDAWRFGPPYPKLTAKAQKEFDTGMKLLKEGKVLSQGMMTYTSKGGAVDVTLTTAVDVRVRKADREAKRTANAASF